MNKLIIKTHSFVDLITNSSSELFICDTNKEIEVVKDILKELCVMHNRKVELAGGKDLIDLNKIFWNKPELKYPSEGYEDRYNHIFGKVDTSKFNFKWCNERGDYLSLKETYNDPHELYTKGQNALYKWEKNNKLPVEHSGEEWREHLKKKDEHADIVFAEYYDLVTKAYHDLLKVYCKDNDVNYDDVSQYVEKDGFCGSLSFRRSCNLTDGVLREFLGELSDSLSWDYTVEKGNIIIESASDNTIPYWMFDDIENIFKANRKHLG